MTNPIDPERVRELIDFLDGEITATAFARNEGAWPDVASSIVEQLLARVAELEGKNRFIRICCRTIADELTNGFRGDPYCDYDLQVVNWAHKEIAALATDEEGR